MAAEFGARTALLLQLIEWEEALIGQHGVKREAAMAFAQDAAVAVGIAGALRINPQDVVIEDTQDLNQRERGADMAAATTFQRVDHQFA